MTQALTVSAPKCLVCGAPVPSPLTVCFQCGGSPFYAAYGTTEYSVLVDAVPALKLRGEVAQLLAGLGDDVSRQELEARLAEGQPPLWAASGLSEQAANALVARLSAMRAPAKAIAGRPPTPSPVAAAANPIVLGFLALGLILLFLFPLVGGMLLVAGAGLGVGAFLRGGKSAHPLLTAPMPQQDVPELDENVRGLVAARRLLPASASSAAEGMTEAVRDVLVRLGNEQDNVGFLAGGLDGDLGRQVQAFVRAARLAIERAAADKGSPESVARVVAMAKAAAEVNADLARLAAAPDAEPDPALRLQRNAKLLGS
jgi:hypothetical protein